MRQLIAHSIAAAVPVALAFMTNAEFAERWRGGGGMGTGLTVVSGAFVSLLAVVIAIIVHGALTCLGGAGMTLVWLVVVMSRVDTRGFSLSHSEGEPAFLAATLTGLGLMWGFYLVITSHRTPRSSR